MGCKWMGKIGCASMGGRDSAVFTPDEQLANEHRQVETQYGNAKIRTAEDLPASICSHRGRIFPALRRWR